MTKEGFARRIRYEMENGIPFTAYWYRYGFGVLRTGPVTLLDNEGKPVLDSKKRPKQKTVSATTLKRWYNAVEKLRRHRYDTVITVDFNGTDCVVEGGELQL